MTIKNRKYVGTDFTSDGFPVPLEPGASTGLALGRGTERHGDTLGLTPGPVSWGPMSSRRGRSQEPEAPQKPSPGPRVPVSVALSPGGVMRISRGGDHKPPPHLTGTLDEGVGLGNPSCPTFLCSVIPPMWRLESGIPCRERRVCQAGLAGPCRLSVMERTS